MSYRVYVLQNKMNRRFIATAADPEDEARRHNKGEFKWTSQFRPWKLEWMGPPMDKHDAERLEKKMVPFKTNANALQHLMEEYSWHVEDFDDEDLAD